MQVKGTRLFRVKAVADMFDVSVSTIYRAIDAGQLFALKVGSGKGAVRIPESAITAFEKSCAYAAEHEVEGWAEEVIETDAGQVVRVAGGDVVSGEVA
jgi:excisionase family DNA binding protein